MDELSDNYGSIINDEPLIETTANIMAYINQHLNENISLDFLCEKFQISKTHLNRKFKETTGSTVGKYIVSKRLVLANELMQKGHPPTYIYSECGFNDYSTFYRAYKSFYKSTPKHYSENTKNI